MVGDLDPRRLQAVQARLPQVQVTTNIDAVLEDPGAEAIVIATPLSTHYSLTKKALQMGKHVLVEKPLCETVEQCQELIDLAGSRNRILAVGHIFLFNAGIKKLRSIIQSGELGDILYIHATRTNLGPYRRDANALWDLASHDLSIFNFWLGKEPVSVTASGGRYLRTNIDDVVIANFHYGDGTMACVHASWLNPRKVREITIVGREKMATWDDLNLIEPIRIYDKSMVVDSPSDYTDTQGAFIAKTRDGDILIPKVPGSEPLAAECAHFIECVKEGKQPLNDALLARDIVGQLQAADRSMENEGRRERIVPDLENPPVPSEQRPEVPVRGKTIRRDERVIYQ